MFWYSSRHGVSFRSFRKSAVVSGSLVKVLKCSMTSLCGSSFMTRVASTKCFDTMCCTITCFTASVAYSIHSSSFGIIRHSCLRWLG